MFYVYIIIAFQLILISLSIIDIVNCIYGSDSLRKRSRIWKFLISRGYGYYLSRMISRYTMKNDSYILTTEIENVVKDYVENHLNCTSFNRDNIENCNSIIVISNKHPSSNIVAVRIAASIREMNMKVICIFYDTVIQDAERNMAEDLHISYYILDRESDVDRQIKNIRLHSLFVSIIVVCGAQRYRPIRGMFDNVIPLTVVSDISDISETDDGKDNEIAYCNTVIISDPGKSFISLITRSKNRFFCHPDLLSTTEMNLTERKNLIDLITRTVKLDLNNIV